MWQCQQLRNHWEITVRCKLKNRDRTRPRWDEGFRVLPIVIEKGLHRSMNFRVPLVHKALVSASKVCHEGCRLFLSTKPGRSDMLHKCTNEWIGLREEKGVYVFDGSDSLAVTWEENGICQLHLLDFPRRENHP